MIRQARADDAPAIAAIWNPIIRDSAITFWPTERDPASIADLIAQRQVDAHAFLVTETAGGITGFASYGQFRGGGGYAKSMEHTVHIAPQSRGCGIGRMLLNAIENHARTGGARLMIGGITASNAGSLLFHARQGYAEWGRVPAAGWKFGTFHDLVFMGKDLTAPFPLRQI